MLQDRLAVLCGHRNAVDAQLVDTIADSLATGSWFMWGVQSPEHFVAWQTGSSSSHARHVVAVARRRDELPCTYALFQAGESSLDQMSVVAAHAPSWADAEVAPLAKHATVSQLRHVLRRYPWPDDAEPEPPAPAAAPAPHDFYSLTFDERGRFRLVAEGDATDGALIDNAINEAHDRLFRESHPDLTWVDALVDVAARSLGAVTSPQRADLYRTYLHIDADNHWLNGGVALPSTLADHLTCDGRFHLLYEKDGRPISIGHAQQIVPNHTRRVVLDRDRACRHPGCNATRHLQVHHLVHWSNDGPSDTWNLAALCPFHHRALHKRLFTMHGNADEPDGIVFHANGIAFGVAAAIPPTGLPPAPPPDHTWQHPAGERLHTWSVAFGDLTGPRPHRTTQAPAGSPNT